MGSDNCNNFFEIDPSSVSSSPFYQTLGSQASSSQSSIVKSVNNEWLGRESAADSENQENDLNAYREPQHLRMSNENLNFRSQKSFSSESSHQHLQPMSTPQWSFPAFGNSYQRFCGDAHYGIVLASNVAQQAPSLHSVGSDIPSQIHAHNNHQMQTNQHLKKIYYQGLTTFIQNRSLLIKNNAFLART